MSCVDVPEPLARLLEALADQNAARLDRDAIDLALKYGWVYEHQGRIGLTGAGAYHAGRQRIVGLLE